MTFIKITNFVVSTFLASLCSCNIQQR